MRKLENSELNRISIDDFKDASKTPLIIVLDDIRSLNNIGSVFRTSDAFLVEKIFLCGITATPPNKEIHKTALGATETVAWEHCENVLEVIEKLKSEGVKVQSAFTLNSNRKTDEQTILNWINEETTVGEVSSIKSRLDEQLLELKKAKKVGFPWLANTFTPNI
jgi:tRNA G18 (ribose-2'-O)-methylase SpoU